MLTLITADNCVDCKVLKHNLPIGHGIRIIDADTPEGMAELAYHEVTAIPCLIDVLKSFYGELNGQEMQIIRWNPEKVSE